MKEAFEKIKERLKEERDNASLERASWKNQQGVLHNRADARNGAFIDALSIVSEVEAEYTKNIMDELLEAKKNCGEDSDCSQCVFGCEDGCRLQELQITGGNNGWIKDRVPSKEECGDFRRNWFRTTVDANGLHTIPMQYEYTTSRGKEISRWLAYGRISPWEVIAWKPMDEPYNPEKGEQDRNGD